MSVNMFINTNYQRIGAGGCTSAVIGKLYLLFYFIFIHCHDQPVLTFSVVQDW